MLEDRTDVYRTCTDEQLATLCGQQPVDEDAWRVFHSRLYNYVWRQVAGRIRQVNTETDDIVQNVFVKVFRSLPNYNPQLSKVRTYISKVVSTCIIDYVRRVSGQELALVEADLRLLHTEAGKDGDVALLVANHLVSRVEDAETVEIMRDLLDGQEARNISTERVVSLSHVYDVRTRLRTLLVELRDDPRLTA